MCGMQRPKDRLDIVNVADLCIVYSRACYTRTQILRFQSSMSLSVELELEEKK
jgi:hypothetical protein